MLEQSFITNHLSIRFLMHFTKRLLALLVPLVLIAPSYGSHNNRFSNKESFFISRLIGINKFYHTPQRNMAVGPVLAKFVVAPLMKVAAPIAVPVALITAGIAVPGAIISEAVAPGKVPGAQSVKNNVYKFGDSVSDRLDRMFGGDEFEVKPGEVWRSYDEEMKRVAQVEANNNQVVSQPVASQPIIKPPVINSIPISSNDFSDSDGWQSPHYNPKPWTTFGQEKNVERVYRETPAIKLVSETSSIPFGNETIKLSGCYGPDSILNRPIHTGRTEQIKVDWGNTPVTGCGSTTPQKGLEGKGFDRLPEQQDTMHVTPITYQNPKPWTDFARQKDNEPQKERIVRSPESYVQGKKELAGAYKWNAGYGKSGAYQLQKGKEPVVPDANFITDDRKSREYEAWKNAKTHIGAVDPVTKQLYKPGKPDRTM